MSNLDWQPTLGAEVTADLGDQADAQAWMSITLDPADGRWYVLFEQSYWDGVELYDYEPVGDGFATLDEAKAAAQAWADNPAA